MAKKKQIESDEIFFCPLREAYKQAAQDLKILFDCANSGKEISCLPMAPLREASRQARESLGPLLKAVERRIG